jgi:hypothetical protein
MTGEDMVLLVSDLVNEEKQKCFPLPRCLRALNLAKDMLVTFIHNLPGEWFMENCTIPTVVGTQSYQLPDGTLYSGKAKCNGTIDFLIVGKQPIFPASDDGFRHYFDDTTSTWSTSPGSFRVYGDYIYLNLKAGAVVDMTLFYPFMPAAIVSSTTEYAWIKGFEYLIPLKAAVILKKSINDDPAAIESEYNMLLNNLVGIGSRTQGYPHMISSGDVGDAESEFA